MTKNRRPPRVAAWLMQIFFSDRGEYTHLGDFIQVYSQTVLERGIFRAWLWYWGQTLKTLPWIISNKIYWSFSMFKNYITTALRNMFKTRGFSLINISGLAIGMASCLLIFLFVQDELSYDRYHEHADNIYRLAVDFKMREQEMQVASVGPVTASVFCEKYPEVLASVRFRDQGDLIIQYEDRSFKESRVIYTESSFFDLFSIPLISGDEKTALSNPHSIILSRAAAEKYFGNEEPMGKTLRIENRTDYTVTGVYEKIPDNTHFHFDMMLSLSSLEESRSPTWLRMNFVTYLLLREGADIPALEKKTEELVRVQVGGEVAKMTGVPAQLIFASNQFRFRFYLQPLTDIHLHSDLLAELEPNSDIKYVYIFSAIALFVLLIAAINFMNLSTARSVGRAKEVGVRKVLGSQRFQLIRQFIAESLFFSLFSMLLALGLVAVLLPFFNHLSGKNLQFEHFANLPMFAAILVITLVTGFFSGVYPAFFLSSFTPAHVLKGTVKKGFRSAPLRKILVVSQFVASIVLIIGTLVVYRQLSFIQHKKLGYSKEQILVLDNAYLLGERAWTFRDEMLQFPDFISGTVSGYLPVPSSRNQTTIFPEGEVQSSTSVQVWSVDYDYIKTLGMTIAEGRNFSREFSTDAQAAIINRRAVKEFGWEEPIGKTLVEAIDTTGKRRELTVIGVVEDFHYESLRENIGPLLMFLGQNRNDIAFRIGTDNVSQAVKELENKWKTFLPSQPFNYFFLDDKFDGLYRSERQIGEIFGVFAVLAIFIGSLGLFGLASYSAERRTKEIGIRKVMGASVPSIFNLLIKEFLILVILSNLIAWPIAFYMMKRWLQDFAYKTPITLWIFLAAGVAALITTLITVSYQSLKSAFSSPIHSLRYE